MTALHVVDLGDPASATTPVLLLHGFTGSSRAWGETLLGRLAEGRRVLAVDLPGHGESPAPSGGFEGVIGGLVGVLDAHGVERADWVGYSMGGRIALAAAVLRPGRIRRLVLEGASPGLESEEERSARRARDEDLVREIELRGMGWFVDHWMALPLFQTQRTQRTLGEEILRAERERRLAADPKGLTAALRELGTGSQPSFWPDLPAIEAPTLLLTGALDEKYQTIADRMAATLLRAHRRSVPGAGHRVHLEAPDAWLDAVAGFLDRHRPEAPAQG